MTQITASTSSSQYQLGFFSQPDHRKTIQTLAKNILDRIICTMLQTSFSWIQRTCSSLMSDLSGSQNGRFPRCTPPRTEGETELESCDGTSLWIIWGGPVLSQPLGEGSSQREEFQKPERMRNRFSILASDGSMPCGHLDIGQ